MNTKTETTKATTLAIESMSCGHCVQAVTKTLSEVPGVRVRSVAVGSAVIESSDGATTGKAVAALEEAGYPAKAVREEESHEATLPAKVGGGCCGGARAASANGAAGARPTGGCCS